MEDWSDGEDPAGPPIHPDDRLWRHPSELRALETPTPTVVRRPVGNRALLGAVVVVAVAGAWWATRALEVHVTPIEVSSESSEPTVRIARAAGTTGNTLATIVSTSTTLAGIAAEQASVGLRVTEVSAESPLARAGVRRGDLVVAIGGIPTTSMDDLSAAIHLLSRKGEVPIEVLRGSRRLELLCDLGRP